MAAPKEIRNRIKATQSTQKTMRAMEMVAASKMRKANQRMARSKPYANKIRQVIRHLATSHSEYHHSYMKPREVKNVGIIVVSTDRGLCGGLNINLFKSLVRKLKVWDEQGIKAKLCIIGSKGRAFFSRTGGDIVAAESNIGDEPTIQDVYGIVNIMIDAFDRQEIDEVYVCANEYVTTMVQQPALTKLLPLEEAEDTEYKHYWDYIYEPDSKQLLDAILKRYIEIQVYQATVENFACQQAATMVAMKSASDNAGELIKEFQLAYNKARQAAITQEIAEIVGGAAAV